MSEWFHWFCKSYSIGIFRGGVFSLKNAMEIDRFGDAGVDFCDFGEFG
jgi:hypothetical protein